MEIYDYTTSGGKNLITDYINNLPKAEKLTTRQLYGKLWEIKASKTRIMYVIINSNAVAFLHICRKQKGKAEKQELSTAIRRAQREQLL